MTISGVEKRGGVGENEYFFEPAPYIFFGADGKVSGEGSQDQVFLRCLGDHWA